ncbi:glycosyltransferase [Dyadobacter fermentans]|uniref:glycosyltransferase n=1 Tax=Dyadobacter fermentans TaxID=94254 RepID=UPI001CBFADFF|nr:nucleotide disphospho-sugar-binding domain-containing protein [Dyadobacter fermentans]MBZ1357191.1 glycosyltransferase [Dyadobacter fermentans]
MIDPKINILFASIPADGHFNPLSGLALFLKQQGHNVRWYTGSSYRSKVAQLGIPFYPFLKAVEINQNNIDELYPERAQIKSAISKIRFDIRNLFLKNINGNLEDILDIKLHFDFDVLVCDSGFMAFDIVQELFNTPAVVLGIAPIPEASIDLPPYGLGLLPGNGMIGRLRDSLLRSTIPRLLFGDSTRCYNDIIRPYGLPQIKDSIFNMIVRKPALFLQSGVPGFEYPRRDLHPNVRFVGPLLPARLRNPPVFYFAKFCANYEKTILISQGTMDNKNPQKLIIPSIEAFVNSNYFLIVATGGQHTASLYNRFPHENILIVDFIDYNSALPYADLFVSSGGYGSVMLSLNHGVPVLAAGKHEGKNEIVARIEYFKFGVNLRTESPTSAQIRKGAEKIWSDPQYKMNVKKIKEQFAEYAPFPLCERNIIDITKSYEVNKLGNPAKVHHRSS